MPFTVRGFREGWKADITHDPPAPDEVRLKVWGTFGLPYWARVPEAMHVVTVRHDTAVRSPTYG
jgi:hypothetical protein